MRKYIMLFLSLFGLAGLAHAAGNLDGVSGFDSKSAANDGPLALAFTPVATDGSYAVTADHVVAIFTVDPGISAAVKKPDTYIRGGSVWILKTLPEGSKLYAIGLGSDWAGPDANIDNIDLTKAKAAGVINGGTAKLDFVRPVGQTCRVVNWVVVLPDGKRAWGPNGNDGSLPYHIHIGGKPATAWCFNGQQVVAMDADRKTGLANKQ